MHTELPMSLMNFGGELYPAEWRDAFESSKPKNANRTMVVTGALAPRHRIHLAASGGAGSRR
jgi:hypothetical protein